MSQHACRIGVLGFLLGALSMGLPWGCASSPRQTVLQAGDVALGAIDNGRTVSVRQGQLILVNLPENPTSGRTWQLVREPDQLVVMPDGERLDANHQSVADDSLVKTQELRFQATGPGETILSLAYVRPGTGLHVSDDRWMIRVEVD